MSRIQDILNKAEREGTVRRTRPFNDGQSAAATMPPPSVDATPAPDEAPPWAPPPMVPDASEETVGTDIRIDRRLVAALAPQSLAAEQYRSLRTRLMRAAAGRSLRSIIITSPAKGDGKTLTAANLALTMAEDFQQRVLLVDADLRRPAQHELFGLGDAAGLTDVLMGASTLESALIAIEDQHLTVLPAGMPATRPAELLGSAAMRRVLETLRARFDRIIFDMPPVEPLADVNILAPLVDGVLMIIRAGMTPKPAIERALAGLDVSRVLGLVLNETGGDGTSERYEGYGYIAG
jgi:capsular exopolysaccharide synthesis family protein